MKKKIFLFVIVFVLVSLAGAYFFDPTRVVRGALTGEPFFDGRPLSYWKEGLVSKNSGHQRDVMQRLVREDGSSVAILSTLFRENTSTEWEDARLRWRVITILGQMGPKAEEALPSLLNALRDDDLHVRTIAATTLGMVATEEQAPQVIPPLIELLKERTTASTAAARVLSQYHGDAREAIPELLRALKDENVEIRWNAARTLGKIGPDAKAAIPALLLATKDPQDVVREHAAEALGDIGSPASEAIPGLLELFKDPAPRVRRDAARSMGQIGVSNDEVIQKLKELSNDEDAEVKMAATRSLRILQPSSSKKK